MMVPLRLLDQQHSRPHNAEVGSSTLPVTTTNSVVPSQPGL